MDWNDLISKVLLALVTGVVASYFTARYALGRYYKEKWWDKRVDLYIQLVDCVYHLKQIANYWYQSELHSNNGYPIPFSYKSKDEEKALGVKFTEEAEKLNRIGELSSLFLTEECGIKIREFKDNEENLYMMWEFDEIDLEDALKSRLEKLIALLDEIITEAKKELNVGKRKFNTKALTNTISKLNIDRDNNNNYYHDNF